MSKLNTKTAASISLALNIKCLLLTCFGVVCKLISKDATPSVAKVIVLIFLLNALFHMLISRLAIPEKLIAQSDRAYSQHNKLISLLKQDK